jgi:lipoprotein-anchoring transpeptidase ErfK/SrfK
MRLFALPHSVRLHKGLFSGLILGAMLAFSAGVHAEPSSQPQPVYPEGPPQGIAVQKAQPEANAAAQGDTDPAGAPQDDAATSEAAAPPAPPKPQVVINVAKDQQRMTVFVDGVETHNWPVSTGKLCYSTPTGSFTVSSMNEIWYSRQWDNAPMPHAIFFRGGYAIHGTYALGRLGREASHGCIRLHPANARELFQMVQDYGPRDTRIVIH